MQTQAYISLDGRSHTGRLSEPGITLRIQDVLGIHLLRCASAFIGLLMPLLSQSSVTSIQLDSSLQTTQMLQNQAVKLDSSLIVNRVSRSCTDGGAYSSSCLALMQNLSVHALRHIT